MKSRVLAALMAPIMALALPALPAAAQNWNAEYVLTGKGHRVGNPEAPIQLVEFISYTCPHCANFERESEAELRYFYIHEGHAAVEVRHFIRNDLDLAIALVTECGPEEGFFDRHRLMLHRQDEWLARARALSPAQQARWNSGTVPSRMRAIAGDIDLYGMMESSGLSRSQIDACLSDQARAEQIDAASQTNAAEFEVPGTPSFVLNGTLLEGVHAWVPLRAILSAFHQAPPEASQ